MEVERRQWWKHGVCLPVLVGLCAVFPAGAGFAATTSAPVRGVAHSAYGVQLSIPRSWRVTYFATCPAPNTLNIGDAPGIAYCPAFDDRGSWVSMAPVAAGGSALKARPITVHGLRVTSTGPRSWSLTSAVLPSSETLGITGSGPGALAVMRTLSLATRRAIPAGGMVTGHEELEALTQVAVTGPVTITNTLSRHRQTTFAIDGGWGVTLPPGRYTARGHDGNSFCPPVTFKVVSGLRVAGPTIRCDGD